jgi:hypothetical protein
LSFHDPLHASGAASGESAKERARVRNGQAIFPDSPEASSHVSKWTGEEDYGPLKLKNTFAASNSQGKLTPFTLCQPGKNRGIIDLFQKTDAAIFGTGEARTR